MSTNEDKPENNAVPEVQIEPEVEAADQAEEDPVVGMHLPNQVRRTNWIGAANADSVQPSFSASEYDLSNKR